MKKIAILFAFILTASASAFSQIPEELREQAQDWITTQGDSLVQDANLPLEQPQLVNIVFDKYMLTAPSNLSITGDNNSPAVIYKTNDGSLGISVQVDLDKKVGEKGALKLCKSMANGFKMNDAKSSKVNIHGMHGATVSGKLEGRAITIAVLADGNRYIKVVVISTPSLAAEAREIVYSIRHIK